MPYKDKEKQKKYLENWREDHRIYHKLKSKEQYRKYKHYLRDKQRAKLGTTNFKSHRLKDFREEQTAINEEKRRTIYNWKPRYFGGQTYYDSLHRHLATIE